MPRDNRPRQRVSQACIPCGQRKTKCDGVVPTCTQCSENSRQCHYGISKRNKTRRPSLILSDSARLPSRVLPKEDISQSGREQIPCNGIHSATASTGSWTNNDDETASLSSLTHDRRGSSGRENDLAVSNEMSARLFKAYFANIHPIWPILYMPMHDTGSSSMDSDAFAPAVLYAVYSIAACVEISNSSPRETPGDQIPSPAVFFEAALLALQKKEGNTRTSTVFHPLNFINPSVESCQTLVILALQQHGLGEGSNAAMLCNIAGGMAIDLKLNEARPSETDHIKTQVASRLWWNVYILDKVLACGLSRPISLRSEDTTAPYPSTAESDEFYLLQFRRSDVDEVVRIKSHTMSGFELTIQLCIILEDLLRATCSVTSKQRICSNFEAAEAMRMSLWNRLKDFNVTLKKSNISTMTNGLFRPNVPPVAIINSMWTLASMILVNRPFHFYWLEYDWSPAQQLPPGHQPIEACLSAARDMSAILAAYVDDLTRLPCDIIFPIVLAAATLWQHGTEAVSQHSQYEVQQQIDLCVKCLSIVGKAWANAGECRRRLMRDFAGASSISAADGTYDQTQVNGYHPSSVKASQGASSIAMNNTNTPMPLLEPNNGLGPVPGEGNYPFLDVLGPRLDEFASSDEGFRAYLETQLSQYGLPEF